MTSGLLTLAQAADRYQRKAPALREFIRRRPWLPGVLRFGRSLLIDPVPFERALMRQPQTRRSLRRAG